MDEEIERHLRSHHPIHELLVKSPLKDRLEAIVEERAEESDNKPSTTPVKPQAGIDIDVAVPDSLAVTTTVLTMVAKNDIETAIAEKVKNDTEGVMDKWKEYAQNMVARRIKVLVHPGTPVGVSECIRQSAIMNVDLGETGNIGAMYDHKTAGEATCRMQQRLHPFRESHCLASVRGATSITTNNNNNLWHSGGGGR